ncbi:hypothetical protein [Bacillus sp. FJAT-49736]|uniref:hypothetical protein n=1 Tax=Bacillus sp. FJAT-49736 TaxID=2833582 RepID=UPI001BC96321|nr:hypothetical protein [Bacillus sp. FJAT-49736]
MLPDQRIYYGMGVNPYMMGYGYPSSYGMGYPMMGYPSYGMMHDPYHHCGHHHWGHHHHGHHHHHGYPENTQMQAQSMSLHMGMPGMMYN